MHVNIEINFYSCSDKTRIKEYKDLSRVASSSISVRPMHIGTNMINMRICKFQLHIWQWVRFSVKQAASDFMEFRNRIVRLRSQCLCFLTSVWFANDSFYWSNDPCLEKMATLMVIPLINSEICPCICSVQLGSSHHQISTYCF